MDDDAILMAIGKLQGQVEGLGREIKSLTIAVGEGSLAMLARHESLSDRVAYLELNGAKISQKNAEGLIKLLDRMDCLEKHVFVEKRVEEETTHWIDSIYAKLGLAAAFIMTLVNFLKDIKIF